MRRITSYGIQIVKLLAENHSSTVENDISTRTRAIDINHIYINYILHEREYYARSELTITLLLLLH